MMKNSILFLIIFIFSIFTCGCNSNIDSGDALSHAKLMNKITVGVKSDSKPFGFIDKKGDLQGFDVDIAHQIAKHILGDENAVDFVIVTPQSRIFDLNSKKIDMIIAIMSVNESRASVVDFSQPYFVAGQAIMVLKNSKVSSPVDLNGKNVGFVLATTGERTVRYLIPNAGLRATKTYPELFELLKKGEVEAIFADDSILYGFAMADKNVKILPKRYTREYYAVAMRKNEESKALKAAVDEALECMHSRGVINRIKEKWLPLLHSQS